MERHIRPFDEMRDADAIVDLSLRAWAPVFESMRKTFGDDVFVRLYPDWREHQEGEVRRNCAPDTTWVADIDDAARGFVVIGLSTDSPLGWIEMLGVDPDYQLRGLGRSLSV